jgi:hypothetical protein
MVVRCFGDDLADFIHDDFHGPPLIQGRRPAAAAMVRNLSNLLSVSAFQSMKITASAFNMRHIN